MSGIRLDRPGLPPASPARKAAASPVSPKTVCATPVKGEDPSGASVGSKQGLPVALQQLLSSQKLSSPMD